MTTEGNIEVEVTIPGDGEGLADTNGDGIADALQTGQALANAEHAAEDAVEAAESAEVAQETAEIALEVAVDADVAATDSNARMERLESVVLVMAEQLSALTSVTTAQAELAIAEPETVTPVPEDEAPENRHWLTRKWF